MKEIVDTATEIESQVQSSDTNENLFRDCPLRNSLVRLRNCSTLFLRIPQNLVFIMSSSNLSGTLQYI